MADIKNNIRALIDSAKQVGGSLGLRPYTITMVTRQWNTPRPGMPGANYTDAELPIVLSDGYAPRITRVNGSDKFLSGGQYTDATISFSVPKTFECCGIVGGYDGYHIDPTYPMAGVNQILFRITNYDQPVSYWKKVETNVTSNFQITLILERTSENL